MAGAGGGHVSSRAVALLEALAAHIPVVITSRVGMGDTLRNSYAYSGGDVDLARRGLINGGRFRPVQARIIVQLLLSQVRNMLPSKRLSLGHDDARRSPKLAGAHNR